MPSRIQQIFGVCVFRYSEDEEVLRGVQDAVDVIGEAGAQNAGLVAIPMGSLDRGFFKLRTGLAGEMLQKFINYRLRVDLLGDFTELASQSTALRDFIRESNRGNTIWFLTDLEELRNRLAAQESH
jgi:hypothetical protein